MGKYIRIRKSKPQRRLFPSEYAERLGQHRCCHYSYDKNGKRVWCDGEIYGSTLRLTVHLEDLEECVLHPILTRCEKHLHPDDILRAKTTNWYTLDERPNGKTELILWQTGMRRELKWSYCFNHRELEKGEVLEWNTMAVEGFDDCVQAKRHAYEMYERYGTATPCGGLLEVS